MKKRNITKANIIKRNKTLKPETKIMEIQVLKNTIYSGKNSYPIYIGFVKVGVSDPRR